MKNRNRKGVLIFVISFVLFGVTAKAQSFDRFTLTPGPEGVSIPVFKFYNQQNKNLFHSYIHQTIIINRKRKGRKKFKEVARVSFPKSAQGLADKAGKEGVAAILKKVHATNIEQAYQIIKENGVDTLGLLMIAPEMQKAMGLFYLDKGWKKEKPVVYRFDREENGTVQKDIKTVSLDGTFPQYETAFKLSDYRVGDSLGFAEWKAEIKTGTNPPDFAELYAYDITKDKSNKIGETLLQPSKGELAARFKAEVPKDSKIAWYMRTKDRAGNLGAPSDTMFALSFNRNEVQNIHGARVTDTLGGLLVHWNQLPLKGYYSGIQILKSRILGKDYFIIDTIPATDTAYLDLHVIPGTIYYYKIRPLFYTLKGLHQMHFVDVSGSKEMSRDIQPGKPQGLTAKVQGDTAVVLDWMPNPELNLYGYMVFRGTSKGSLTRIAWPVKRNHFVDTNFLKGYSGQYVYAVQVMNQAQQMSDTSDVASVYIRQPAVLPSPGGINAYNVPEGIQLEWNNTRKLNSSIIGYIVYRRVKGDQYFQVLNTTPLPVAQYVDTTAERAVDYQYAVSSIDAWSNQSILSPIANAHLDLKNFLKPPSRVSLLNTDEGIRLSWPKPYHVNNRVYVIYRAASGTHSYKKLATTNPTEPYIDKTVKHQVLYKYKVAVALKDKEGNKSKAYMIRRR